MLIAALKDMEIVDLKEEKSHLYSYWPNYPQFGTPSKLKPPTLCPCISMFHFYRLVFFF